MPVVVCMEVAATQGLVALARPVPVVVCTEAILPAPQLAPRPAVLELVVRCPAPLGWVRRYPAVDSHRPRLLVGLRQLSWAIHSRRG